MMEKLKILVAGLLVVAGVAGFYLLADSPMVLRVLAVLGGLVAAGVMFAWTGAGKQFLVFSQESVAEARKVVWPTRKETMQMTGIVILFVLVMAIFLWMVDGALFWMVKHLMGRGS